MSAPAVTLRGDLSGTAFGGTPTWTDYTSFLELGDDGQPIGIAWGRQDKNSEVQVARFQLVLNNTDGRFTTGASIITTAHQFNVRITHNATTYDRVTGYVETVEVRWPGEVGSFCTVLVTCVDISGRLGEAQPLRSLFEYEVLTDNPGAFYPCTEPAGGKTVGNIAATPRPSGVLVASKFGPSDTFDLGSDPVITDEATSFATAATGAIGDFKAGAIQLPRGLVTAAPFTVELCFAATPGSGNGAQTLLSFSRGLDANDFAAFIQLTPSLGALTFYIQRDQDFGGSGNNVGNGVAPVYNVIDGEIHHCVVGLEADGVTPFMYLDGRAQTSVFVNDIPLPITKLARSVPYVGLPNPSLAGFGYSYGLNGRVGMLAFYPGVRLSAARVSAHYAAFGGNTGERSDQRFERIAARGGITTTGLPVGQATMGPQQVSGRTALETLREVARTEGGPMLVTPAGALTFQPRSARYNPTDAFTPAAGELNPDLVVRRDRDGLVNDQTYERYRGGQQRFFDQPSITAYGRRDGGGGTIAPATDEDARQHAAWDVTTGKTPQLRMSTVTADLLTQPSNALVQAFLAATVSTPFTVTALPSQTPGGTSMGLFIEGAQEQIGVESWTIQLYTSPTAAIPATLVADGTATARTKLDTGLKVGF